MATSFEEEAAATSGLFTGYYLWINPANWTNGVPVDGEAVTDDVATTAVDDIASLSLASLSLEGSVVVAGTLTINTLTLSGSVELETDGNAANAPSVTIDSLVGSGALIFAVGPDATTTLLGSTDPGETYEVAGGGEVELSATPNASSSFYYNGPGTFAFDAPGSTVSSALDNVAVGDSVALPGSSVSSVVYGSDTLSITTNLGTTTFTNVTYSGTVPTDYAVSTDPSGLERIIFVASQISISGSQADQATTDQAGLDPFADETISDPNLNQIETVTVAESATANGTLIDPNAASDGSTLSNGVWTVTGSLAAVTADLNALEFQPTIGQVPPGQSVTTTFTLTVTDTLGVGASDSTTSVVATAQTPLTVLVDFNGSGDGQNPGFELRSDADDDLFGTTQGGGANGDGTVFELPDNANTATGYPSAPTTLFNFNSASGSPQGGLITDANGDLFGVTDDGGANNAGTVFEIANTATGYASTPTILVNFATSEGSYPYETLLADQQGDLFGTLYQAGADGDGAVFELVKTASAYTLKILAGFGGADGDGPEGPLIADANGDLFGVTQYGGVNNDGTVFEIVRTASGYASTPVVLAYLNEASGISPVGGLIADANGDLFGATPFGGGTDNQGTVFEIPKTATGYGPLVTLVNFNGTNGAYPVPDALLADANGDLFGTTSGGGDFNDGTVFEIVNTASGYASTPTVLASLNGTDGAVTYTALIADAEGDLYGEAVSGGTNNDGTLFELTDTPFVVDPITLGGSQADQATTDQAGLDPFADETISDPNLNQIETVTVAESAIANGTLIDPNAASDGSTLSNGVWTVTGSLAAVTADLNALEFQPTIGQVPPGQSVTTTFTLTVTDTLEVGAGDGTNVTASNGPALRTLASFNPVTGGDSVASLVEDPNGDLFGTTYYDGNDDQGGVFELAKTATGYATTPTPLVLFNGADGAQPEGNVVLDSNGDLLTTTTVGGANNQGAVVEIPKTATGYADTPMVLASTEGVTTGANDDGLLADSNGDLFGTGLFGGANGSPDYGYGTVFELVKTATGYASTLTNLVVFNGTDGREPVGTLIADANGDLFGVTYMTVAGSTESDGTVFELINNGGGSYTLNTLVSFNGMDGAHPVAGVVADANGDLFGTASEGGTYGDGTVFELINNGGGSYTPKVLLDFDGTDGANPEGSLIIDADGDLFGTTSSGGAGGSGTVFEIAKTATTYASTPIIIAEVGGAAGLLADASGNLFGTTQGGGPVTTEASGSYDDGIIFEIIDSGFVTTGFYWNGGTGSWDVAGNWSSQQVPNGTDTAYITAASINVVNTSAAGGDAAGSLTISTSSTLNIPTLFTVETALTNSGTVNVEDGAELVVSDTLDDTGAGTIALDSTGDPTTLQIAGSVALEGTGTVTLSDSPNNQIASNGSAATLDNESDIFGSGEIGDANLTLVNEQSGVIEATYSTTPLTLNTGANTITNDGTLEATAAGVMEIDSNVDNSGTVNVEDGATLVVTGTLDDTGAGTVALDSTGDLTKLEIAGNVTLEGTGTLTLSDNFNNQIASNGSAATLDNESNIFGDGEIDDANLTLINAQGGLIEGPLPLIYTGANTVINQGIIEGTGTIGTQISSNVDNEGGTIEAIGLSMQLVVLFGVTVAGGTLTTSGTGVVVALRGTLDGASDGALDNLGSLTVDYATTLQGTIDNSGTITVASNSLATPELVIHGDVSLDGAGSVRLFPIYGFTPQIVSDGSPATLGNQNDIFGSGEIGDANLTLVNEQSGVIEATYSTTPLTLNTGANTITNDGTLEAENGATLDVVSNLAGVGTVMITAASAEFDGSVSAGQTFIIDPSTITIGDPAQFAGTLDLSDGDELIVDGATGGSYANGAFTFDLAGGGEVTIAAPGDSESDFSFSSSGDTLEITDTTPCYCRGTLILAERGEVPVEELAIRDRVATRNGLRPIKWIGRRSCDPRFIRDQKSVLPVVISAGALGDGMPARDLWVSPEHALYLDAVLVPAKLLVNGMTIIQAETVERLEYFHIELDSHGVILAEGTPAETYIECDNRMMFHNAGEFAELYPATPVVDAIAFCAPRLEDGAAALTAIHARLLARAAALGYQVTGDPGVHLIVDGIAVEPLAVEDGVYRFTLDQPAGVIYLASRSIVPAETDAAVRDRRRLGVCLRRITLSDTDLTLDLVPDHHLLRDGFHEPEGEHRWTAGLAQLPASVLDLFTGLLTIEIATWPSQLRYAERTA